MPFRVLSVFANAGLATDDEMYVVVKTDKHGVSREIYSTRQSELFDGHTPETLAAAFTLAWKDVRVRQSGRGADASWQMEVKRHPAFDGGQSGWGSCGRYYADQGRDAVENALAERRSRHALYLLSLNPRFLERYTVKDAMNNAAANAVLVRPGRQVAANMPSVNETGLTTKAAPV